MSNTLIKAISFDDYVLIYAADVTGVVFDLQKLHDLYPLASVALGKTIAVSAIMGAMLKGKENLRVIVKGDGPLGEITADANRLIEVRGYVKNPHVHIDNSDGRLSEHVAIGQKGEIKVIKDLGLKDYFISTVDLVTGELGKDFTYYFAKSEQIPSAVGCGVLVDTDYSILAAGSFIIQVMPGASDEIISRLEKLVKEIKPVSELIKDGFTPADIVQEICSGERFTVLEKIPIKHTCYCSKDRYTQGLITLGKDELKKILTEDKGLEIVCHFCGTKYLYAEQDLRDLIDSL